MTIAWDSSADGGNEGAGNTETFTHTPTGTPAGILVFAYTYTTGTGDVTGITYGGVSLVQVDASLPVNKTTGETGTVDAYFLGDAAAIAGRTGDSVVITSTSASHAGCSHIVTSTTSSDTEVNNFATYQSDTGADPLNQTLTLGGISSFCAQGWYTGYYDATLITPLTNWTGRHAEDRGAEGFGSHSYDTIGTADVTFGYSGAADDTAMIAVAIKEAAAAGSIIERTLTDISIATGIVDGSPINA